MERAMSRGVLLKETPSLTFPSGSVTFMGSWGKSLEVKEGKSTCVEFGLLFVQLVEVTESFLEEGWLLHELVGTTYLYVFVLEDGGSRGLLGSFVFLSLVGLLFCRLR